MKVVKYLMFMCAGLFLSSYCLSSEELELRYMGYIFKIPPQPITITSSGDAANILNFIYGEDVPLRQYLSIGNLNDDALVKSIENQENCTYKLFLSDIFNQQMNSGCNQEYKDIFYNVMLRGNEYGAWPSNDLDIYYVIGKETAYVLIAGKDSVDVTFESNFLDKGKLKELVSNYIQY